MKEATIQKILEVCPHTNADALEIVKVLGWQIVVKKGEFKPGDLCVYITIDSTVPETPEFEFLRTKHFRIKPMRLRGVEKCRGICFPLNVFNSKLTKKPCTDLSPDGPFFYLVNEGDDVTDTLGIKHYEKPVPAELAGQAHGGIPGFLIITDEDNLRTYPTALSELWGRPYYITRKDDGCSGTFYIRNGEFGVCSRRIHLKESESNGFWRMARKYDVEAVLRKAFPDTDIALQGEIVGPGIQDNHLGLKEMELHFFNLFEIVRRHYLGYNALVKFAQEYRIPMVHTIVEGTAFGYTVEELVKLASEQKYYIPPDKTSPAEGIVIRPQEGFTSQVLKKYWSGKVLNPLFEEEKKKKK